LQKLLPKTAVAHIEFIWIKDKTFLDGWVGGWTDRQTDRWMDIWTDGRTYRYMHFTISLKQTLKKHTSNFLKFAHE